MESTSAVAVKHAMSHAVLKMSLDDISCFNKGQVHNTVPVRLLSFEQRNHKQQRKKVTMALGSLLLPLILLAIGVSVGTLVLKNSGAAMVRL
jgi:hypothetical protein